MDRLAFQNTSACSLVKIIQKKHGMPTCNMCVSVRWMKLNVQMIKAKIDILMESIGEKTR